MISIILTIKNGIMKCYSSNDDFMNIIKETKDSKRQANKERIRNHINIL